MILMLSDLGPLGLYEEIYDARAPCTSYATENTDYLTTTLVQLCISATNTVSLEVLYSLIQ